MKLQYTKRPSRRVTIKDLADDLGLSVGAVSQALNPRDNINIKLKPETIERVRKHARSMNYRPHAGASSIRSKHFGNIGYMLASPMFDILEPSMAEMGIHDAALAHNFRVTLLRVPSVRSKDKEAYSRVFNESHLDALIMLGYEQMPANYEKIFEETEFPIIYLNYKQDYQAIYTDDITGARTVTEHLIGKGYKNICYYRAKDPVLEQTPHYSVYDRYAGYQQAMKNSGLEPQKPWYFDAHNPQATINWLSGPDKPDAVVCASDSDAAHFFGIAYNMGLRVPDDIAVTGYNDDAASEFSWMPLTTMKVPYYDMAITAFTKTMEQINSDSPEPFSSLTIEPTLQVRASSSKKMAEELIYRKMALA